MGGNESTQVDSEYFKKISFHLNILICGDYIEESLDLDNVRKSEQHEGLKYIKKGKHKNINEWDFYFFKKDKQIGENTFEVLRGFLKKKDYKNLIIFYSGLEYFTYEDLLKFYDKKPDSYHINTIIITKNYEKFVLPDLKKFNTNLIRNLNEKDKIEQLINIIEITSYCNELGDEIGFPKKFINDSLLEADNQLMMKYSFTFNILICGKPGSGKSTLINKILGKAKCFSGKGTSSLTSHVVKYIHDKYPLVIYDTPGFEKPTDIERIKQLIIDKNTTLNEEKNRIHCVLYCINTSSERTFIEKEFEFLVGLLDQKMDVFFIATHAKSKENAKDYIEATKISLFQNSNNDKRVEGLENYIYPVELINDEFYKKFGLKELFTFLYNKYKKEKINEEITKFNLKEIKSSFLKDVISKDDIIKRLTALAKRAKSNFKLLASSMGNSPNIKGTTMLSTAIIKIISKIYNHPIKTADCLDLIESKKYTNELKGNDTYRRKIEKTFACVFYKNGPAASEVECLSEYIIKEYNNELRLDRIFYEFLNQYKDGINSAIECLNEITD
jgi:GTPase Era involved in 16S rRNA processing